MKLVLGLSISQWWYGGVACNTGWLVVGWQHSIQQLGFGASGLYFNTRVIIDSGGSNNTGFVVFVTKLLECGYPWYAVYMDIFLKQRPWLRKRLKMETRYFLSNAIKNYRDCLLICCLRSLFNRSSKFLNFISYCPNIICHGLVFNIWSIQVREDLPLCVQIFMGTEWVSWVLPLILRKERA